MDETKSGADPNLALSNIKYGYGHYIEGDGICIQALLFGELYADVTVNLVGQGIVPGPNQVIIPAYKHHKEVVDAFKRDLVKRVIRKVHYGNFDAYGELVELADDWKDKCVPLEDLLSLEQSK